jgi:anti-sigma factor RsiW
MTFYETHLETNKHDVLDKLDRFIDGQLPPGETVRVRRHLACCDCCAGEYQRRVLLRERLRQAVSSQGPSPFLHTRLSARLQRHDRVPSGMHWRSQVEACQEA